ncbi:MAG: hypothetical protein FWE42_04495 [Defluviitaleaceae bacterium]|nr:hypothetical protein [Defluviitaleaceae bacterium]
MQEFLLLICVLLFIAFLQKGAEYLLDKNDLSKSYKNVFQIACVLTSYFVVGRYVYVHLLEDLIALIGFTF